MASQDASRCRVEDEGNPFSTRYVRPGKLAFRFAENDSAAAVVRRLRAGEWNGAILGPHGSGKTTLLAALRPELEAQGRVVVMLTVRQEARLPMRFSRLLRLKRGTLLIVDGYEQLGIFARALLRWARRLRGFGLLITAHESQPGVEAVYVTKPCLSVAKELVGDLMADRLDLEVDHDTIREAFDATGGDVREMLFCLYDDYERGRRASDRQ